MYIDENEIDFDPVDGMLGGGMFVNRVPRAVVVGQGLVLSNWGGGAYVDADLGLLENYVEGVQFRGAGTQGGTSPDATIDAAETVSIAATAQYQSTVYGLLGRVMVGSGGGAILNGSVTVEKPWWGNSEYTSGSESAEQFTIQATSLEGAPTFVLLFTRARHDGSRFFEPSYIRNDFQIASTGGGDLGDQAIDAADATIDLTFSGTITNASIQFWAIHAERINPLAIMKLWHAARISDASAPSPGRPRRRARKGDPREDGQSTVLARLFGK